MAKEIDFHIGNGEHALNRVFDKSRNRHRIEMNHPENVTLTRIQESLLKPNLEESDKDWFESSVIVSDENGFYSAIA